MFYFVEIKKGPIDVVSIYVWTFVTFRIGFLPIMPLIFRRLLIRLEDSGCYGFDRKNIKLCGLRLKKKTNIF